MSPITSMPALAGARLIAEKAATKKATPTSASTLFPSRSMASTLKSKRSVSWLIEKAPLLAWRKAKARLIDSFIGPLIPPAGLSLPLPEERETSRR